MSKMSTCALNIGVMAIQGAFDEHIFCLKSAFEQLRNEGDELAAERILEVREVRTSEDLQDLHGLVIPGGESTTMAKFLLRRNFIAALKAFSTGGNSLNRPPVVWGTCAGLILLSDEILEEKQGTLCKIGGLPVTSSRNIYGRQRESFERQLELHPNLELGGNSLFKGIFIRAPGIESVNSDDVTVLASIKSSSGKSQPVAVEFEHLMASTFHPELTNDHRWHRYFLNKCMT